MKPMLVSAAVILLAFVALRFAGAREAVATLSGTAAPQTLGVAYVLAHFAVVVLVPVLLIASGLLAGARLLRVAKRAPRGSRDDEP